MFYFTLNAGLLNPTSCVLPACVILSIQAYIVYSPHEKYVQCWNATQNLPYSVDLCVCVYYVLLSVLPHLGYVVIIFDSSHSNVPFFFFFSLYWTQCRFINNDIAANHIPEIARQITLRNFGTCKKKTIPRRFPYLDSSLSITLFLCIA